MRSTLFPAMFAVLLAATPAHAETENCTEITALPFTIAAQGIYCLKQNLNVNLASGNAITINAGNVTIDFNGWRVNNQAAATNGARGIHAFNRKQITLRNGFVRGFRLGVYIAEGAANASQGHVIEDMKFGDSNYVGIWVEGDQTTIRNNRVLDTGGGGGTVAEGIHLGLADDSLVSGNQVSGISETTDNKGVFVTGSSRVLITGNTITDTAGSPVDQGIVVETGSAIIVKGNELLNSTGGGETGIIDLGGVTDLSCLDNDIGGYATPLSGCDDDLGNRTLFN